MKTLRLSSHNLHKLEEIRAVMAPLGYDVRDLTDLPAYDVVEDGDTFEANALKKARALHAHSQDIALADDSGLSMDALHGGPGVYSARWANAEGGDQDAANNAKLLQSIAHVEKPTGRFVCVLAYIEPGQEPIIVRGEVEGTITREARGTNGFGYDCLFIPNGSDRTFGEQTTAEKNAVSHRSQALHKLVEILKSRQYSGHSLG
ncbi:MAG: RdgB/HAM1 family non-canonical purine NTP pyrophosphatase [Clostridia bacterium]|nr:RdgB/HAM1 family non-canonical purine NTP pyrophosphatase [Deltaproteobacteria bacterium]